MRNPARRHILGIATGVLAVPALICSANATDGNPSNIGIEKLAFINPNPTVTMGTRVLFWNHDNTPHTATAYGGTFDTGTLNAGEFARILMPQRGTFGYFCRFHRSMTRTITVI